MFMEIIRSLGLIKIKYMRKNVKNDEEMLVEVRLWGYTEVLLRRMYYVFEEN